MRPLMSLPIEIVRPECEFWNSSDSMTWRSAMISRRELGTSMPTVGLPGMRSIRMDSACRPRHRSSVRVVMRLYLMPASGLNSKVVTTGPGLICTTDPSTLNSSNFALTRMAMSLSSCSSYWLRPGASLSRLVGGRRNVGMRRRAAARGTSVGPAGDRFSGRAASLRTGRWESPRPRARVRARLRRRDSGSDRPARWRARVPPAPQALAGRLALFRFPPLRFLAAPP